MVNSYHANAQAMINKDVLGRWKLVINESQIANSCGGCIKIFVQPSDGFKSLSAVKVLSNPRKVVVPTEQILCPSDLALFTILQAVSSTL